MGPGAVNEPTTIIKYTAVKRVEIVSCALSQNVSYLYAMEGEIPLND